MLGPAAPATMRPGSFLITRLVPVGDEWLLSGYSQTLPASSRRDVLDIAERVALQQPALAFRNPQKLEQGWELQRRERQDFIAYFESDMVVILKAQDPFAHTVEERQRQRDNFLRANRQVSAILEWMQRHGPDDLFARFDERAAKRFHVQKVYVFLLGRYLAHFGDGLNPDRRAASGSRPRVLQVVENGLFDPDGRNPLGALFTRLRDVTAPSAPATAASQTIAVGDLRLRIFPTFADMRSEDDRPV